MSRPGKLKRIVSGGQTGVDRAALDTAIELGLEVGGWCPKGRLAQDGPISDFYPLKETPSSKYAERTEWNVRDSDATLILHFGSLYGGTALTVNLARRYDRPFFLVDLSECYSVLAVEQWIEDQGIVTLNLAGPREETQPGIYARAHQFMLELLGDLTCLES
jgi:hypothetical protein